MTGRYTRRRALAAVGSALAAAGCLEGGGVGPTGTPDSLEESPPPTSTVVRLSPGDRAEGNGTAVTVSNPRVQKTFVYDNSVWRSVEGEAGMQYLLVDVATEGFERPSVSLFDVALDGRPLDADAWATTGDAEVVSGGVAFPVPVGPADSATVVWKREEGPAVEWEMPAAVLQRLASAPEFVVRDATFSQAEGLAVTVANEGDRDGTFRLRISQSNAYDISQMATVDVPAGATRTLRVTPDEYTALTPDPGVTIQLSWGTGSTEVPI